MTNLEIFAAATNNEIFDPEYKSGSWSYEHAETQESLEQFIESSSAWATRTPHATGSIGGFPFVAWKSMQLRAGQPRESFSVVDLGDRRIAIHGVNLVHFQ